MRGSYQDPEQSHDVNDGPLVSAIVPVYNGQSFVEQAIQSALSQTYRNIEIIVIDDGSTDGTLGIVNRYAADDSRIQIVKQLNGGVARARNRGIAMAKGDFIAPLDADDLWDPTKIERQVRRILAAGEETGFVYCWWIWIDEYGAVLDRSPSWRVEGETLSTLLQVNYTGSASIPMYRRRCVLEVGGYDETLEHRRGRGCEDWDLALRVAGRYRVAVVPAPLAGYRRSPASMSTDCEEMWRSQKLVTDGLRQRQPDLDPDLFQRSADQFALYLAGIQFRAGAYHRAFRWTLRAWRSGLLFHALPYIIRMLLGQLSLRRRSRHEIMKPGVRLENFLIASPLIPYDRIYARRAGRTRDRAVRAPQPSRENRSC